MKGLKEHYQTHHLRGKRFHQVASAHKKVRSVTCEVTAIKNFFSFSQSCLLLRKNIRRPVNRTVDEALEATFDDTIDLLKHYIGSHKFFKVADV